MLLQRLLRQQFIAKNGLPGLPLGAKMHFKTTAEFLEKRTEDCNALVEPGIYRDFNPVEFDGFRKGAGLNSFTLLPNVHPPTP